MIFSSKLRNVLVIFALLGCIFGSIFYFGLYLTSDASRMESVFIHHRFTTPDTVEKAIPALQSLLKETDLPISIAAIRHSMGGHTYTEGGIVVDILPLKELVFDQEKQLLRVGSGATWSDVIAFLDPLGWSVAVMQASNSFSVGGSVSVNCHGWPQNFPPIASTVESFRIMMADGEVLNCSREENEELFSLALGGYGLFGIILDVELHVVPNARYLLKRSYQRTDRYTEKLNVFLEDLPHVQMAYGRLSPMRKNRMKESIVNVFYVDPEGGKIPPLSGPKLGKLMGWIYRTSGKGESAKVLRWQSEAKLAKLMQPEAYSRNQLFNEPVDAYLNLSSGSTDILHEYFVPKGEFTNFVEDMRTIIDRHQGNLLNVTVRSVEADNDTFLPYVKEPSYAFVLAFRVKRNTKSDLLMEGMTRDLIDAAILRKGSFYLPYRLHARPDQLKRAYPEIGQFFSLKKKYDPEERFQNQFYRFYRSHFAKNTL